MSSLFSPFAAAGNTSYFSCSCSQRGPCLSKKQSCKSETEKPSYVASCFPPFRIVYFYMFSRVSYKRGFRSQGQTSHSAPWNSLKHVLPRVFCLHTPIFTSSECFLGRYIFFHVRISSPERAVPSAAQCAKHIWRGSSFDVSLSMFSLSILLFS